MWVLAVHIPGQALDVLGTVRVLGSASNIGINTSYPGEQLDINGTARMKQLIMSGGVPALNYVLTALDTAGDTTWSTAGIVSGWTVSTNSIYTTVATNNVGIGSSYPGQLLDVQGTVRILGGGNLGIGTSYPGVALDVNGTIRNLGSTIALGNVGIGTSLINGTGEAALTVMNGNVGIGTWLPNGKLDVEGTLSITTFAGNVGIGTWVPQGDIDIKVGSYENYMNSSGSQLEINSFLFANDGADIAAGSQGGIAAFKFFHFHQAKPVLYKYGRALEILFMILLMRMAMWVLAHSHPVSSWMSLGHSI